MALVQHDVDVWSTEIETGWQGGLIRLPVRMTVLRLDGGRLVLHSPIPISAGLRAQLEALGEVGFIVVPQAHGKFAAQAAEAFPAARLLAAPKAPWRRKAVPFDGSLSDEPPAEWRDRVECLRVRGFRLNEVVLFHRPSRTLVLTDLCFNIRRSSSRAARVFFRADGIWQRFAPARLIRWLAVSDRDAFHASLERILRWDFERIIPGHGDVIERGGPAAYGRRGSGSWFWRHGLGLPGSRRSRGSSTIACVRSSVPVPDDNAPEVERTLLERWRAMTPAEKRERDLPVRVGASR